MTLRFKRAKSLFDLRCSEGMDIISDITHWPVCKRYLEKQVAKCVTECKSQAAEAKKVVGGIARSKKKRAQVAAGSAGEPDDFDSDGWSSNEFDTDDEEEEKDYSNTINGDGFSASDFASDNVSTNGPESVASSDSSGPYNDVSLEIRPTMPGRTGLWNVKGPPTGKELDTTTLEPSVVLKSVSPLPSEGLQTPPPPTWPSKPTRSPIPKPPSTALPQLGKFTSTGNGNVVHRRSVPRLQRPPSQPPAPPPSKNQLEPETPMSEEEDSEYEIPICGIPAQQGLPGQQVMVKVHPSAPLHFPPQRHPAVPNGGSHWTHPSQRSMEDTACTQDSSSNDMYEPIDKPEEKTYEAVDDPVPALVNFPDCAMPLPPTPCLPPRKPASLPPHFLVPPLPEKPSKMVTPPIHQQHAVTETHPVLPSSKGPSSSKSMSQLVSKFRSKLGGRRESNISLKDVEVAVQAVQEPTAPSLSSNDNPVTVNGTSISMSSPGSVFVSIPVPPPLPSVCHPVPQRPSTQQNSQTGNYDPGSMTCRPLPPVPSSPDKNEERLDLLPYYVDMEREEAVHKLMSLQEEDAYLVRPSRRAGLNNPYTLTLIHNSKVFHLNIRLRPDGCYALGRRKDNEMVFKSVSALVTHHQHHPIYLSAQGNIVGTSLLRRHL